ncbi:unnamed protein product, partial [Allacma fusca]
PQLHSVSIRWREKIRPPFQV